MIKTLVVLVVIQMVVGVGYVGLVDQPVHKTPSGIHTNLIGCDREIDFMWSVVRPISGCKAWEANVLWGPIRRVDDMTIYVPICDRYYLCRGMVQVLVDYCPVSITSGHSKPYYIDSETCSDQKPFGILGYWR